MNTWHLIGMGGLFGQTVYQGTRAMQDLLNTPEGALVPSDHIFSFLFLTITAFLMVVGFRYVHANH